MTTTKPIYFWKRSIAFLIDVTIGMLLSVFFPFAFAIYEVAAVNQWGMTLGKLLVGLRVVRDDGSGKPPGLRRTILRSFMKLMPFLWPLILLDFWKERRGWHDFWSNTNVEPLAFTRKLQTYRVVLGVLWAIALSSLGFSLYQYDSEHSSMTERGVTAQEVQATSVFVKKLSPLLTPPGDNSVTPDEKYRLCIETAQREFGSQTTEEQRKNVCKDYAYTTAEQADAALRQMYEDIENVPVAQRSSWCLENGSYLFPEEKNMHLRCMLLVEHWDDFWKAMREASAKKVQELYP